MAHKTVSPEHTHLTLNWLAALPRHIILFRQPDASSKDDGGQTEMGDAALKWPQTEIQKMEEGAERFLTSDVNRASWERWKIAVLTAARDTEHSRKAFYVLRTIALISAITVPSLVGLNLSGTGGSVVRWLTFALSLITAIVTGIVTLYRIGDRWLMYRRLRDDLMAIGWALVPDPDLDAEGDQKAWAKFIAATDKSLAQYNRTYEVAVIQAAQSSPEPSDHGSHKDVLPSVPG